MKKFLWDNEILKKACPAAKLYGTCHGNKICIDSREIEQDDIFVAFKGEAVDGHDYVSDALKRGASCAIVEHQPKDLKSKDHLMIVANAKKTLKELSVFNRNRSTAKIIGITGSVGKTSTREALLLACSVDGKSYCSKKNFNNELGLPISLASMPLDTKYGIFELGMNQKGEIEQLTKILKPHLAIITKIAAAHIGFFNSLKNIALAKGEIFLGMKKNGIAILNGDDEYYSLLADLASKQGITNICRFGENPNNENRLIKYKSGKIKANICGTEINYEINAIGRHQALNTVAVLSAVNKLGIDLNTAATALLKFSNIEGRGQSLKLKLGNKKILLIDDSYNANPTSIKAALDAMKELSLEKNFRRKIAVLGDMVELGSFSKNSHKELAEPFEASGINKLITVGPQMKYLFDLVTENKKLKHFFDYNDAIKNILNLIEDGDYILFKGSHGTKIYEIVKHLKKQTT